MSTWSPTRLRAWPFRFSSLVEINRQIAKWMKIKLLVRPWFVFGSLWVRLRFTFVCLWVGFVIMASVITRESAIFLLGLFLLDPWRMISIFDCLHIQVANSPNGTDPSTRLWYTRYSPHLRSSSVPSLPKIKFWVVGSWRDATGCGGTF